MQLILSQNGRNAIVMGAMYGKVINTGNEICFISPLSIVSLFIAH